MMTFGRQGAGLRLLIMLAGAALATGCDPESLCTVQDDLQLKVVGSCPEGPVRVNLALDFCRLRFWGATGNTGLPETGALAQMPRPVREGGWQIYGQVCPTSATPCPEPEFRLCKAERVAWQLDLLCLDGAGQPVCEATLTE
jgi:hypothetical protein